MDGTGASLIEDKLAIAGWSYGGYAALQSQVLDPALFKAVVAIAPVTDLGFLIADARDYTNSRLVRDYVGEGPHVASGSPRRHAERFAAPVALFHGTRDLNVDVRHAQAMERAFKAEKFNPIDMMVGLCNRETGTLLGKHFRQRRFGKVAYVGRTTEGSAVSDISARTFGRHVVWPAWPRRDTCLTTPTISSGTIFSVISRFFLPARATSSFWAAMIG